MATGSVSATLMLGGCGKGDSGGGGMYDLIARLQSTAMANASFQLWLRGASLVEKLSLPVVMTNATITNIDGMADSFLVYTEEDGCAFNLWRASGTSGTLGAVDATPQTFDLADPESWTASRGGLRQGCAGAAAKWAGMIFQYMDFHITHNSTTKVVRLMMGDAKSDFSGTRDTTARVFYRGDLIIKDQGAADSTFAWADSSGTAYPVSGSRPSSPIKVSEIANDPVSTDPDDPFWYEWQFSLKNSDGSAFTGTMTSSIVKGVLDVQTDQIEASITGGTPSNNGQFLNQLSVNLFSNLNLVSAVPTFLTKDQIGGTTDPDLSSDKGTVP